MALKKTAYEYAKTKAVQSAKPTPVTQPESKPTPTASTSSSDLSDEVYPRLKKPITTLKPRPIKSAYHLAAVTKIATGLVAEMPDKEWVMALHGNRHPADQWNRFEISTKQPIKVETDVELNRALKRLQKKLREQISPQLMARLMASLLSCSFRRKIEGANGSREKMLIDRVNGKFTYAMLF